MLGRNCEDAAVEALRSFPGGLQIGGRSCIFIRTNIFIDLQYTTLMKGGINLENAMEYLNEGASHIIVTSYVFNDGKIDFSRLQALRNLVGRDRLVIDLSCRRKKDVEDSLFYVVTNKWTKYTDFAVT
jgi:phosphoribosylformimino-5-aminoimidazole carboxamide ribotide isomerase